MHLHFMKYLHNLTKAWWYWHGWFWLNTIRNTILYRLCNSLSTCRLIISVHCFILIWFLCIISLITIREVYVCFQYQLTVYIHVAKRAIVRNFMIWFTWCLKEILGLLWLSIYFVGLFQYQKQKGYDSWSRYLSDFEWFKLWLKCYK